jgi:dUTP pyrophosphatase
VNDQAVMFELLAEDARPPERATRHSAGYDIRAHLRRGPVKVIRASVGAEEEVLPDPGLLLEPGDRALIPTGFKAQLPEGVEGQIRIRSSVAWKKGLVVSNAPGTTDSDYPDEWFVLVQNASTGPQTIEHGDRIAQLILNRYELLPWLEGQVGVSSDRVGGIGSTSK